MEEGGTISFAGYFGAGFGLTGGQQQAYDPRADFRDFAIELSNSRTIFNDCMKLALLAYKAGQIWNNSDEIVHGLLSGLTERNSVLGTGSNPDFRVGVFLDDPHHARSFGGNGFNGNYQGFPLRDTSNQVRHATAYLAMGYHLGRAGTTSALSMLEDDSSLSNPDVALGYAMSEIGQEFHKQNTSMKFEIGRVPGLSTTISNRPASPGILANQIWRNICGGTSDLTF